MISLVSDIPDRHGALNPREARYQKRTQVHEISFDILDAIYRLRITDCGLQNADKERLIDRLVRRTLPRSWYRTGSRTVVQRLRPTYTTQSGGQKNLYWLGAFYGSRMENS